MTRLPTKNIIRDLGVVFLSVIIAILLLRANIVQTILLQTRGIELISSFIAGIFFTNVFTAAPATVVLAQLASSNSLFLVAFVGSLGALLGDFIMFRFIKDALADDIMYLLGKAGHYRFFSIFHTRLFRSLMPFIGGLIIASPLPDALGLALLLW